MQLVRPYGVGIDCHSRFIQVCVLVQGEALRRWERSYGVAWAELRAARDWVVSVLRANGLPCDPLEYTIESTGCYHMPVIAAFGGRPAVVNPLLASPGRRKTDVLDGRLLAYHSLTGLWPASYLASAEVEEIRVLLLRRRAMMRHATHAAQHINSILLRYAHTIGAYGSVRSAPVRSVVEDLARSGRCVPHPGISPVVIPPAAASAILDAYAEVDRATSESARILRVALSCARAAEWNTDGGRVGGKGLLENLCTVPGIGEATALLWLARVADATRFQNAAQIRAYVGSDPSVKVSAGKVTSTARRKGDPQLHAGLLRAAQALVRRRAEPFGQWAYRIVRRRKRGAYNAGVGACARRLAEALYWVHRKNEPFSYDGYAPLPGADSVQDLPLAGNLPDRVVRAFAGAGILRSRQLFVWLYEGGRDIRDVGPKSLSEVVAWLEKLTTRPAKRRTRKPRRRASS